MTGCRSAIYKGAVAETKHPSQSLVSDMSKKYQEVRDKIPLPSGGFVEAVRMALIDLSCFGEGGNLDIAGYPHDSERAALLSDWAALGVDFREAVRKVAAEKQGDDRVERTREPVGAASSE